MRYIIVLPAAMMTQGASLPLGLVGASLRLQERSPLLFLSIDKGAPQPPAFSDLLWFESFFRDSLALFRLVLCFTLMVLAMLKKILVAVCWLCGRHFCRFWKVAVRIAECPVHPRTRAPSNRGPGPRPLGGTGPVQQGALAPIHPELRIPYTRGPGAGPRPNGGAGPIYQGTGPYPPGPRLPGDSGLVRPGAWAYLPGARGRGAGSQPPVGPGPSPVSQHAFIQASSSD